MEKKVKKTAAILSMIVLILCSIPVFGQENTETPDPSQLPAGSLESSSESVEDNPIEGSLSGITLKTQNQDDTIADCLVSAYGTESTETSFYTFLSPDDLEEEGLQVRLTGSEAGSESGTDSSEVDGAGFSTDFIVPVTYSDYLKKQRLGIKYLFLIDRSTSMGSYTDKISEYILSIVDEDKTNEIDASYSIAGCGKKMELIKENITDKETVRDTLNSMAGTYTELETNLYSGVVNALKTINGQALQPGSLTSLILITDGEPWLEEDKDAQALAEEAQKRIEEYPDVVVHTLCLNEWKEEADKYLCVGKGRQDILGEDSSAEKNGSEVSDFISDLYLCVFTTQDCHAGDLLDLKIEYQYDRKLEDGSTLKNKVTGSSNTLTNARIKKISGEGMALDSESPETVSQDYASGADSSDSSRDSTAEFSMDTINTSGLFSSDQAGTSASAGENAENAGTGSPAGENVENAGTGSPAGENAENAGTGSPAGVIAKNAVTDISEKENAKSDSTGGESVIEPTPGGQDSGEGAGNSRLYIIAGIAAVILAAAAAAFLLSKKKKGKGGPLTAVPSGGESAGPSAGGHEKAKKPGILIRIEVYQGSLVSEKDTFYLNRELILGSDPGLCSAVFAGGGVSPRHARIFLRDGVICIEDLGSEKGTYLGNMRLVSSNRLRSGDKLRLGDTVFSAWF